MLMTSGLIFGPETEVRQPHAPFSKKRGSRKLFAECVCATVCGRSEKGSPGRQKAFARHRTLEPLASNNKRGEKKLKIFWKIGLTPVRRRIKIIKRV
jgi:hypothetical protein